MDCNIRQRVLDAEKLRYVEQRTDHNDALTRLSEIAKETSDPVISLTIGGWPAIQRRHVGPREQPGAAAAPLEPATLLTITTAIAAGNQLVRRFSIISSAAVP